MFGTQAVKIETIRFERTDPVLPIHRARTRASRAARPAHVYRAISARNAGYASWYTGRMGACGVPLTGMYVASRTLPCGTHVRVSYGGRSVVATVLDRGPISQSRVFDLCRNAFESLAPLSKGVIYVSWFIVK
jgi:rare lipoprotein A (peptidoglycan hydrolase)